MHPEHLPLPEEPVIGAAAVHALLMGWRRMLAGREATAPAAAEPVT
jgi:hypothetical protein